MTNPLTRKAAKAAGATYYFTGKPCKHGHVAKRLASNGSCHACWQEKYDRERVAIIAKASEWNRVNRSRRSEITRQSNARCAERVRARRKKYAEANRERISQVNRAWRKANPDKRRRNEKLYRKRHPEKMKIRWAVKRFRRKGAAGRFSKAEIDKIRALQRGRCAYCRQSLARVNEHKDHIIPIALGGTNDARNIQLLCEPCNLSKHAKHPVAYARELGRLL